MQVEDLDATVPTLVTVRDSLLTTSPTAALSTEALLLTTFSGANPATVDVRGSTILANGSGSRFAVLSQPSSGAPAATIALRNTIARLQAADPGEGDVGADRGIVTASHSSFDTRVELNGGTVTAPGSAGNVVGDPLFTNFGAGDYTLQATSPLIDRGDPALVVPGELDLAGNPRAVAAAPDIGAFERQLPPAPPSPASPANSAPRMSHVGMTNKVFAPAPLRASAARARKVKRGTTFRYTLSEPATLTIAVERRARGRRVHGRCGKATHRNRHHRRCARWLRAGTLRVREQAGRQSTYFSGRFKRRALKPGRYRARVRARDGEGARSAERRLAFRVVRAR
jgi:hypothetical protein